MLEMSVDQARIEAVMTALRYEEDGKQLRKDLTAQLRAAVEPALPEIRSGLAVIGRAEAAVSPALAATVASKVRIGVRGTGDRAGVRVSIGRSGMPRNFANAPKRLNSRKGWRHPVFGNRQVWVRQVGAPEYFDRPLWARRDEMREAVRKAVEEMSERIARRSGRG